MALPRRYGRELVDYDPSARLTARHRGPDFVCLVSNGSAAIQDGVIKPAAPFHGQHKLNSCADASSRSRDGFVHVDLDQRP